MDLLTAVVLGGGACAAGFVDAVVGGGGLIQTPLLLSVFPTHTPATLFGTNKIASIVGTSSAAVQYARRVPIPWRFALPGALAALAGAWFGARAVAYLPPEVVRPLVLVLLIAVAVYTFRRKDFGAGGGVAPLGRRSQVIAAAIGGGIGFYDGFFGPGTGSFFIFLLIRCLGLDFLRASVTAKILNVATNLAAIAYFAANVEILWQVGGLMALFNLLGAQLGSRMALRRGVPFVRRMFLGVVSVLIIRLSLDTFGLI
jgi:uncharacterized protein